ncbi:hypothetical protein B0T09DRAFT_337406 [Sordaria sp. MPI-SDFR-AT-0083]|nr:hypothetical protein B0T09DRAFT_337406 [Sordaria sp. MPI-SDFR-AT-0083]
MKSPRCSHLYKWDRDWTRPFFFFFILAWCRMKYKATLPIQRMSQRARHSISEMISFLTWFGGVAQGLVVDVECCPSECRGKKVKLAQNKEVGEMMVMARNRTSLISAAEVKLTPIMLWGDDIPVLLCLAGNCLLTTNQMPSPHMDFWSFKVGKL